MLSRSIRQSSNVHNYLMRPSIYSSHFFHTSFPILDNESEAAPVSKKVAAAEYNSKKAFYKREVSALRKKYASEVALQRAADEAERLAREKKEKRELLERQRRRNIKAAKSSLRQREIQLERQKEWEEELRITQQNRDARNERFRKARQLVIDELEKEAHLWLTTPEEIEKAFTKEAEQELWTFPNSVLGAPVPTEDVKYWNLETHTWHLDKTYRTQQEALTQEFLEKAYDSANIDDEYWTPEKLLERKKLEEKAKLRAMVREAGRRSLLMRQKEMLQDIYTDNSEHGGKSENKVKVPRPMPVPNVKLLANEEAMEREGVEILLKDPTKFFEFDVSSSSSSDETPSSNYKRNEDGSYEVVGYEGPSLGSPIALRNDVMIEKDLKKPFPDYLGKLPKPDTRTAKQKKRDERQRAMMAAAQEASDLLDDDDENKISSSSLEPPEEIDEDEAEWLESLDPVKDAELYDMPPRNRYTMQDIDALIKNLEEKQEHLTSELEAELEGLQTHFKSGFMKKEEEMVPDDHDRELNIMVGNEKHDVESFGIEKEELSRLLDSFTEEQMVELFMIEEENSRKKKKKKKKGNDDDGDDDDDDEIVTTMSQSELEEKLKNVPGLTTEQIDSFLRIEKTLAASDVLKEKKLDTTALPDDMVE